MTDVIGVVGRMGGVVADRRGNSHLDDFGVTDRDPDSGTVTRGERFEEIRPLLEPMDDNREELPVDWP